MKLDKKWAIRLAWLIGGMCCGVLISTNDDTLTEMIQVCPACDCLETVTDDQPTQEGETEAQPETEDPASQPVNPAEEDQTTDEAAQDQPAE